MCIRDRERVACPLALRERVRERAACPLALRERVRERALTGCSDDRPDRDS